MDVSSSRRAETGSVVASVIGRTSVPVCWLASSAIRERKPSASRSGLGYWNDPLQKRDHPAFDQGFASPTSTSWPASARERTAATAWFWLPSSTRIFMFRRIRPQEFVAAPPGPHSQPRPAPQRIAGQSATNRTARLKLQHCPRNFGGVRDRVTTPRLLRQRTAPH